MRIIRLRKPKRTAESRYFPRIFAMICIPATVVMLIVYIVLTSQRLGTLRDRTRDGADLLALRVQDKLSGMQGAGVYLGSLTGINTLLVQETPSMKTFSDYDKVLRSVSGGDLFVELMFHKSRKVLISDYGLSDYDTYYDRDLLQRLLADKKQPDHWELRDYRQNMYTTPQRVLSYIRSLPLSSVRNDGYIIVSQPLSSLAKTAGTYADGHLGDYAVWLEDMLLVSSADPAGAEGAGVFSSGVGTNTRASYWIPSGVMLSRALPRPLTAIAVWLAVMLLCAAVAGILCRRRVARLNALIRKFGGEWDDGAEEGDPEEKLYRIFEDLTAEVTRARQLVREAAKPQTGPTAADDDPSDGSAAEAVEAEVGNRYVEDALLFIHENYTKIRNVSEIGEIISVNPIYLNRLFKSVTGMTLSGYLSQYRCGQARKMLLESDASVREISDACGFSDVRGFTRYFKIYNEETPTEYRRRLKG